MAFFPPLGPATTVNAIQPKGWDRCVLQGQVIPGRVRVTQGSCKLKRDGKPKKGTHGANPTYNGLDPQPVDIEITTYSDADRELLAKQVMPLIPQTGQTTKSVSIDHPSLRMNRVSAVDIVGATPLIPVGDTQVAKMTLHMFHSLPAKQANATVTPKGAPVRKTPNTRTPANPLPTQQKGFVLPPAGTFAPV